MEQTFEGRAGIVTGASSGIGRSIARRLGAAGMELWLVGRSAEQLALTADEIAAAGNSAVHCAPLDISEPGALAALVAEVGARHPYLFTLINNAGVMYPEPVVAAQPERWREMFAINLFAPMEGCRAAVEQMRRHRRPGHLINISSLAGQMAEFGAYSVSKAGVNQLGRTLRYELENDDIRVTTIAPGGFTSNLGRGFTAEALERLQQAASKLQIDLTGPDAHKVMGDPEHIASLIDYLLRQPIEINLDEISIRPAVTIDLS